MGAQDYLEPRYPWLIFGDGALAQLLKKIIVKGENGAEMVRLVLRPVDETAAKYDLKESDYTTYYTVVPAVVKDYNVDEYYPLDDNPSTAAVIMFCDFNGQATKLTRVIEDYQRSNRSLQKENNSLRAENASLHEENRQMTSQVGVHIRKQVDNFKEVLKLRKNIEDKDSELGDQYKPTISK